VGQTIEGKVVRVTNFGAFVELDEGIEGLIHVSSWTIRRAGEDRAAGRSDLPDEDHQAGAVERKIGLSIRAMKSDEFRTDWEEYSERSGSGEATLGDHFKAKA
jgi:small subunit ribosomal protein S1